jgi:hypothetical protein
MVDLFSINKAPKNGFTLSNGSISIRLAKVLISLCFDCIIPTENGFITGVKMNAMHHDATYNAFTNITISKSFDINQLYKILGHFFGNVKEYSSKDSQYDNSWKRGSL